MPFGQEEEMIGTAYFLHNNIWYLRVLGLVLIAYPVASIFRTTSSVVRITLATVMGFYLVVVYMFNFRMLADKMFLQPKTTSYLTVDENKNIKPTQLIVGVSINGESKAYPIQLIGYHHQVRDVVGNTPVMVTYCTVCRTGRVFSPFVDGKEETFRL